MDLAAQLDRSLAEQNKYQNLLRELLEAQRSRESEQLTKEQLALFEAAWQAQHPQSQSDEHDDADIDDAAQDGQRGPTQRRSGVDVRCWRGIWSGNGSYTIWQKRKSTAMAAAGTCG